MNTEEFFERRSSELERRYRAGDYPALVEAVLQFSDAGDAGLARPLPRWVWEAVVEHLVVRFDMPISGRKGRPGPKKSTDAYERRRARWLTVSACVFAKQAGFLDLDWLNGRRAANGLWALAANDVDGIKGPFQYAEAILRGAPAHASADTLENEYYRALKEGSPS